MPAARLRVLVVWEPVLATDWAPPTSSVLARISDARAAQYWDHDRVLSQKILASGFKNPLSGPVVWDAVGLFAPGVRWESSFPQPEFSGAPVANVIGELRERVAHSYSSASTSEVRTADSAGPMAAIMAAPRMMGTSNSAIWNGNR